jgi:hypothetical protein
MRRCGWSRNLNIDEAFGLIGPQRQKEKITLDIRCFFNMYKTASERYLFYL